MGTSATQESSATSPSPLSRKDLLRTALREHLAALGEQLQQLQIEVTASAVHQARVAGRRLRTVLLVFGDLVPRRKCKRWRREVQRMMRALSPLRDVDVQIAFLGEYLGQLPARDALVRPGLDRLLLRLGQRQSRLLSKARGAVRRLRECEMLDSLARWLGPERPTGRKKQSNPAKSSSPRKLHRARRRAARLIARRLQKVLARRDALKRPQARYEHHRLRIAVKRLRYTLDACAPLDAGRLKPLQKQVRNWQTLLGDVHDCDVWLGMLPEFRTAELVSCREFFGGDQEFAPLAPGLDHLAHDRRQERTRLFHEFRRAFAADLNSPRWREFRTGSNRKR